jgi:hypothetical protein
MPQFWNAGVGSAGINSKAVGNSFKLLNHRNVDAPYSAISVRIFLKMRILCLDVQEISKSQFNTYNNPRFNICVCAVVRRR